MVAFIRNLSGFLTSMDAKTATSLAVSAVLLIFVVLMLFYGQAWLNLEGEGAVTQLSQLLMSASASPYALIGVVSIYSLLALTGFPQILLITGTIIVFGPQTGAFYAWMATMASATLTFGLGHFLGGRWVRQMGGERVERTIEFLRRRGVAASALIRVVPSAPFVVVNAAAGAAHILIWKYWVGTGLGIIPKIAFVAVLGAVAPDAATLSEGVAGIVDFFTSRKPSDLAILALIVAGWIGFLFVARLIYRRMRAKQGAL